MFETGSTFGGFEFAKQVVPDKDPWSGDGNALSPNFSLVLETTCNEVRSLVCNGTSVQAVIIL